MANVKFTIVDEESVDFTDSETKYTANVTFKPIRSKSQNVDYYVALIGPAFELNYDFVSLFKEFV